MGSGAPTPNDFKIGARAVRGWWECPSPGFSYGSVTVVPGSPDHASAIADESLKADDSKRGADLTQSNPAKQPIFDVGVSAVNGLPVIHSEAGRVSLLQTTHSDVLGVVNDVPANTPHVILAVWGATGANSILCQWSGGTGFEYGLHVLSGELKSSRYDGSTSSYKTFGSGLGSLVATPQVVCVLYHADLTADLWVGGQYRASVTHADLDALGTSYFKVHDDNSVVQDSSTAALAVFAGDHEYTGTLRAIAQAMGARWGGLAA